MSAVAADALFDAIADGAARESRLWADALLAPGSRETVPVFSPLLSEPRYALGIETIYEGYLLHYGRARLFAPADEDIALLLGDTLLAHGLVRIAATGSTTAVGDVAALLSLCAQARSDGLEGDGPAWAATSALLMDRIAPLAVLTVVLLGVCLRVPAPRRHPYLVATAGSALGVFLIWPFLQTTGLDVLWEGPVVPVIGLLDVTREELVLASVYSLRLAAVSLAFAIYALVVDHDRLVGGRDRPDAIPADALSRLRNRLR